MKTKIFYFFIIMLMCVAARAQFNGQPDSTFGTNGAIKVMNQAYETQSDFSAYGSDDKLYVASITGGQNVNILLSRFNQNGSVDNTFGNNGNVVFNPSVIGDDQVLNMKLDPNNKIIICGYSDFGAPLGYQAIIARFNSDGSADLTFNQTGLAIMGNNYTDVWYDCALEPNGDITVAGAISHANGSHLATVRYKANGDLDSGYGYNGVSTLDLSDDEYIMDIERKNSNKFILLCYIDDVPYVMAIDGNGDQDYSFAGGSGKIKLDVLTGFEVFIQKLRLVGNNIFFVGHAKNDQTNKDDVLVGKMNTSGVLNQNFGYNGFFRSDLGATDLDMAFDVQILNDGSALLSGAVKDASNKTRMATFLIALDGTLNAGYGTLGVMKYFTNELSVATSMTKDNQGKIVLCGYKNDGNTTNGVLLKLKTFTSGIGFNENDIANNIVSLYPNPASNSLFLELSNQEETEINIDLLDLNGSIIFNKQISTSLGNQRIDLSDDINNLSAGVYLVKMVSGNQSQIQKFIKQ